MSRKERKPKRDAAPDAAAPRSGAWRGLWPFAVLTLAVAIFYWTPLTSAAASIQWDAVDVHYSAQKYFADHLREGRLPFWTPYIFSGFPFLADPQVGAWYPLNWPFFLVGITPRAIEWELALHALLGAAGAYLLGLRLLESTRAALGAAMLFAFSGFFAGHSSHVGMFQAAACFPWLLAGFFGALETRRLRYAALAAAAGGCMGLTGHFQTALYGFAALAVAAGACAARDRAQWRRIAALFAGICVVAAMIGAIVILPGLELTANSNRASMNTSASMEGVLDPRALATLIHPDFLGGISGKYTGPGDPTQYYFYGGILLLPLAFVGLRRGVGRLVPAVLLVLGIWYAAGPWLGLSRIAGLLPGFRSVRAPVHIWFVAALGLALLAGRGLERIERRWPKAAVMAAVLLFLFCDLFYWNSAENPLAYARAGFDDVYGRAEEMLGRVAASQAPLTRFQAPDKLVALGPLNGPLDVHLEATYGYNPLELHAYSQYRQAAAKSTALVAGLNVARRLNLDSGAVEETTALPRAYFPRRLEYAASEGESARKLASVEPPETAVVRSAPFGVVQDPTASASFVANDEQSCQIKVHSASSGLLRVAIPFYPGWHASVDGAEARIVRVDHALMGMVAPAGDHEVRLWFRPTLFFWGAGLSLAGLAICLAVGVAGARPAPAA